IGRDDADRTGRRYTRDGQGRRRALAREDLDRLRNRVGDIAALDLGAIGKGDEVDAGRDIAEADDASRIVRVTVDGIADRAEDGVVRGVRRDDADALDDRLVLELDGDVETAGRRRGRVHGKGQGCDLVRDDRRGLRIGRNVIALRDGRHRYGSVTGQHAVELDRAFGQVVVAIAVVADDEAIG